MKLPPTLVVVPARTGSKGVPGKNFQRLAEPPLRGPTLFQHAVLSGQIPQSMVVVSSDAPMRGLHSREWDLVEGQDWFARHRPESLATDDAPLDDVLLDVLREYLHVRPEYVITLQPDCPLRPNGLVEACLQRIIAQDADSLITVRRLHFVWRHHVVVDAPVPELGLDCWPPADAGRPINCRLGVTGGGTVRPNRQDMQAADLLYEEVGSVSIVKTAFLEATGHRVGGHVVMHEISGPATLEIDTPEQLAMARAVWGASWRPYGPTLGWPTGDESVR